MSSRREAAGEAARSWRVSMIGVLPPQRFRNPNFVRAALLWLVPVVLGVGLLVSDSNAAIGSLLLVGAVPSGFYARSWCRADVLALPDRVEIGGVFRRRIVPWSEVQRFEILPPARRTPVTLVFRPWTLQARVRLADGSVARVRAIDPRRPFTPLTAFGMMHPTKADHVVEWLNDLVSAPV